MFGWLAFTAFSPIYKHPNRHVDDVLRHQEGSVVHNYVSQYLPREGAVTSS